MDPTEYDKFVKSLSHKGTGGASGHDAPMIAYESILRTYTSNLITFLLRICYLYLC